MAMAKLDLDSLVEECPWEDWKAAVRYGMTQETWFRKFWLPDRDIQDEEFDWFKHRGLLLGYEQSLKPGTLVLMLMPIEYVDPPPRCYHATPLVLWRTKIHGDALRRGRDCKEATSKRRSSGHNIYVSFSPEDAAHWTTSSLLGSHSNTDTWAILEVDVVGTGCKVFRDPRSGGGTGYVLDTRCVPRRFLRHAGNALGGEFTTAEHQ